MENKEKLQKVELILPILNGMPNIKATFQSLKESNYKNFKIIVQDGGSKDGTLNYIESQKEFFEIDLISAPDSCSAQACVRALKRSSKNDFIVFIAADEEIERDFFDIHLSYFNKNPNLLAIYGSVLLFDPRKNTKQIFNAGSFSLKKVINCECIPPISTCMFNAKALKDDFWMDENEFNPDYDLWVRLALKYPEEKFLNIPDLLTRNRMDEVSTSFRSNSYLIQARSKVSILKKNLELINNHKSLNGININQLFIGIYCWAAQMVFSLSNANQDFVDILCEAIKNYGKSEKLLELASKSDEIQDWLEKGSKGNLILDEMKILKNQKLSNISLNLSQGSILSHNGAKKLFSFRKNVKFIGGNSDWDYIWQFKFENYQKKNKKLRSISCLIQVERGQLGICILNNENIDNEFIIGVENSKKEILLKIRKSNQNPSLIIRNGGQSKSIGTISMLKLFVE